MVVMIAGISWVPKGVAKKIPDKVKLDNETLKELVEGGEEVPESTDVGEDSGDEEEEKMDETKAPAATGLRGSAPDLGPEESTDDPVLDEYLKNYDQEEDKATSRSNAMKGIAVFANNLNDPYITNQDDSEEEQEKEDYELKPTDNLVTVAKIEGDAYSLEVHVFNEDNDDWYVHHDYILEAPPMCVETINYDPGNDESSRGNLLAVGTMESSINIWDLDVVNAVMPVVTLGKVKKEKRKKRDGTAQGHSDAVLCLGWNLLTKHVLASGSVDKTVVLWDLDQAKAAQILPNFERELQTLRWHPAESTVMAVGTFGGQVAVVDCRNVEAAFPAKWELGAQVEKVVWDHFNPFSIVAATDDGYLSYLDTRNPTAPLWKVLAHEGGCADVSIAPKNLRCLLTVGADEQLAVWKLNSDNTVTKVHSEKLSLGELHSVTFSPDSDSIAAVGGEQNDLVRIVNLSKYETVVNAFS